MRKDLRIIVNIGGATRGLWSAISSEHRYPQAVAIALADAGYKVDCVGTGNSAHDPPSWGEMPPLPNVEFLGMWDAKDREYDICLNTPFQVAPWLGLGKWGPYDCCDTYQIRARVYVHFTFGWQQSIVDTYGCYARNHILVYPRLGLANLADGKYNPFIYMFLPIPIGKAFNEVIPEQRKSFTWTSKDVFHPDWYPNRMTVPCIGLEMLKTLAQLSKKHSEMKVNFLGTRYFDEEVSGVAKLLQVQKHLADIPNKELHGFIPHDALSSMLRTSRMTLPISGMWSSFGESICAGSAPLAYGSLYNPVGNERLPTPQSEFDYFPTAQRLGLTVDQNRAVQKDLYPVLERVYEDDALYLELIEGYRESVGRYLYPECVRCFEAMVERVL